jgi:hypothetical protein
MPIERYAFNASEVSSSLMHTSRQVTDLTQEILIQSRMRLRSTLTTSSDPEQIILTGSFFNGTISGFFLPYEQKVVFDITNLRSAFDPENFRITLTRNLKTEQVYFSPLYEMHSGIYQPAPSAL